MGANDPRCVIREIRRENARLVVRWEDGHASTFHSRWLRDACRCDACGDPRRGRRLFTVGEITAAVMVSSHDIDPSGALRVTWAPDGHRSAYEPDWLRAHCPSTAERTRRRHRPVLWDERLARGSIELRYDEVTGGDAGLLRLLELVRDYGLAFVHGTPPALDVVERVAGLIGYIPETNYGRVFDYYADPTPSTPANAADFLAPHTDEAYRHRPPQIALFHAIRQSVDGGGASLFVDGFNAAERLRGQDPDAFDFLTRVPLSYHRIQPGTPAGAEAPPEGLLPPKHTGADLRSQGRTIALDVDGRVSGIRFADINMGPPDLPEDLVEAYYRSVGAFARIVRDPGMRLVAPLATGDMAFFDNERILHGRAAFDAAAGGRHIRSTYVDRESFHSQLRLLGRRMGRGDAELTLPGGFGP